jgi:hypothetical protein
MTGRGWFCITSASIMQLTLGALEGMLVLTTRYAIYYDIR